MEFDVSITMRPSYNFIDLAMFRGDITLLRKDLANNIIDVKGNTFDKSGLYPVSGIADWSTNNIINIPDYGLRIDYLTGSMINNAGWKHDITLKFTDVSNNIANQYTKIIWYSLNSLDM